MKIRVCCYLLLIVVMLCYSRAVIPDTRSEYHEPFCVRTKSTFGNIQCSFLKRSAEIAPILFYWTVWTADKRIEKCSISAEPDLIENYLSLCREMRIWDVHETQSLNLDIKKLLEPSSSCEFIPYALRHLTWYKRNLDMAEVQRFGGKIRQKRAWILPGTFWCGHGSSAGDYEQLGMFEPVDRCCREHDHCSHIILPFTLNFGVFNPTLFTVSHCDCDHRFKQCLLDINGTVSNMVGYTFFNILKVRCFDLIKKKRCTEINWFGMCTSIQVAPFAILKYPTPYNAVSSNHDNSVITDQPVYQAKPSINTKPINIKTKQRKHPKPQGNYDQLTHLREDAFWLSEKLKQQYATRKTLLTRTTTLPSVWNTTTHFNSLTTHNSKLVNQKKQTVHPRTSFQKSELFPTISTHVHTTASQGCHDKKTLLAKFPKKKFANRRKMTTSQTHTNANTTAQQTKMIQSSKPLRAKLNCLPIKPPRCDNLNKQLREKCRKVDNTSKHKSLYVTASAKFLTSSLANIKGKKSKRQKSKGKNAKQKIKVNHSFNVTSFVEIKNKSTEVIKDSKTRNPCSAKLMPLIKNRNTLWRNVTSQPKTKATSLVQDTSRATAKFKNSSCTKQELISSAMKNTLVKKSCKSSKKDFSMTNTTFKTKTRLSGYAALKQKSKSILKQNMGSITEKRKTHNPSSHWNITMFTSEDLKSTESPSICDAAKYLDDCKYRIHPMEKTYGHYNTESTTIYHCDCIHKLTSHLKQFKKAKIMEFVLAKFVSMSCIEMSSIKECNKPKGWRALLSKVQDQLAAKDEKEPSPKRSSDQLYKHCLRILNPRNLRHAKNGLL